MIWEVPRAAATLQRHSKAMAWVASTRLYAGGTRTASFKERMNHWRQLRDDIHAEVCKGFDSELNSFTQYYGSNCSMRSLLMLVTVVFLPP